MKVNPKTFFYLQLFGLAIFPVGIWLMHEDWKFVLGLFLVLFANNISQAKNV